MNQNLRKISKKKIVVFCIIIVCFVTFIFIIYKSYSEKNISYALEDNETSDTSNFVYIENEIGEYENYVGSSFPNHNYILNEEKSYCNYGGAIENNLSLNSVSFLTSGSENCYLYYDRQTFKDAILTSNAPKETADKLQTVEDVKKAISNKGTPDFSIISTSNEGMYAATDDYGTSYYFRGAVNNNWVKFAGYYWRIVRIDGNGNIKLIYSGTDVTTENGIINNEPQDIASNKSFMTKDNKIKGTFIGLEYEVYVKPTGVGYIYGSKYYEVNGTSRTSNAKSLIDAWAKTNLNSYSEYMIPSVFCVDRTGTGKNEFKLLQSGPLYYSPYTRARNNNPSLKCTNNKDKLNSNIGLLSSDESIFAGAVHNKKNIDYYLFSNDSYWLLSPALYSSQGFAYVHKITNEGSLGEHGVLSEGYDIGLRPVIYLKGNLYATGTGLYNDPFIPRL